MAADRPNLDVPDVPLDAERRRRILTQAAARFRRRRRRRSSAALGIAAALVVVASVALVGRLGQTTTRVATSPGVEAGSSAARGPGVPTNAPRVEPTTAPAGLPEPSPEAVADGRFVHAVALDGGALVVRPAPADVQPTVAKQQAEQQFWVTGQLAGTYQSIVFGFGLVTVRATVVATRAAQGGGQVPFGGVAAMPAWVGFPLGAAISCPAMPVPSVGSTSSITGHVSSGTGLARAVVIPAGPGGPSAGSTYAVANYPFVYRTTHGACTQDLYPPAIEPAQEIESVAWTLLSQGPASAEVGYTLDCDLHRADTHSLARPSGVMVVGDILTILAAREAGPAPSCPARPAGEPTGTVSVPWLAGAPPMQHAPVGPYNVVQGPGIPVS